MDGMTQIKDTVAVDSLRNGDRLAPPYGAADIDEPIEVVPAKLFTSTLDVTVDSGSGPRLDETGDVVNAA